jgi:hypothetical protein
MRCTRRTGDALSPARGQPQKLGTAVFPTVAEFTRVCLYDRPDTALGDGETGGQLWAQHFNGGPDDAFDFQDRTSATIVSVVEGEVQ